MTSAKLFINLLRKLPYKNGVRTLGTISTTEMPEVQAMCPQIGSHEELYKFSIEQPDKFWSTLARSRLSWEEDFHTGMDCDFRQGKFGWFLGGKLNVSVNCVDRWASIDPDRVAMVWEKDEPGQEEMVTYSQLKEMVGRVANCLKAAGVVKGDVVALYLPVSPLAVACMLATARLGAVHSVVFAGFSAEALAARVNDAGAKVVITADEALRGAKKIPLKPTVDQAMAECPGVKTVFVVKRTGSDIPMGGRDVWLEEAMAGVSPDCEPTPVESEDPLFLLYTSGSTGKPKGVTHSSAGYLLYAAVTHKHAFDYQPGELFGCVADIGWITGHSYVVYGPLANGGTTLLFESTPSYPDPGRYWETVQRLRINHFYGSPTALRYLIRYGDHFVTKYDRSSLRKLGSVGEPLNQEAWHWFYSVVGEGRCDLVDTWWQTETGGVAIAPRPSAIGAPLAPSKPQRPMFGMNPVLMDDKGKAMEGNGVSGALCMGTPWPGIARTVHGDHKRFVETYFSAYPGYYFTGDGALRDKDGFYQITGRMDDVINVTGHRLGTAEVEDALTEHTAVAEAAVVGFPHEVKGEGVYAYIILKEGYEENVSETEKELKQLVKGKISGFAVPEIIQFTTGLPKTRSGKIMRRILRKVAASQTDDLGDISTLADPSVVQVIVENHNRIKK
eukprot:GFUD01030297.1.p1 GENE.GFUD01030297.1~~GFUD01030297.1.p1  ORF type:complete len:671 (+),score=211.01 GFUD01030297.1:164-2176(+)